MDKEIVEHKMNQIKALWNDIESFTGLDLLNVSISQQVPCGSNETPGPLKKEFYFNFGKVLREENNG